MSDKHETIKTAPAQPPGKVGKIRAYAQIGILLSMFFTAFAWGGDAGKEILTPEERLWLTDNRSRIVLAVETGYAPFVFLDAKNRPTGLAHDYLRLIEEKLGVRFAQERFSALDDIFKKVRGGEVHIVNAVTNTPRRATFLAFTDSFIAVPNVIVVNKDHSVRMGEENLSGLKVSLVKSYAVTEYLANKNLGFTPDLVPDDLTALLNVSFGRSDAAVIDLATASYLITQKGVTNLRFAGETLFSIRLSMAVPIDKPVLLGILKKGLGAITETERQEIHKRWINVSGQSIFSDRRFQLAVGSVLAVIAIILAWNRTLRRQVAERKEAERKLARSEARLRANLDNTPNVAIQWYDADGRVSYWNPASERLFGWKAEETIGRTLDALILGTDEAAKFRGILARIKESGEPYGPYEVEIRTRDARTVWTTSTVFAIPMEGGQTGYACMDVDVTERKLAEQELRRSNAELEQFSYAISHDMRQPLRMISSYLGLLEKSLAGRLDGDNREYFHFAIDGAQRLDRMLLALLEYSRVGRKGEPPARVESRALLDEALLFLQPAIAEAQAVVKISGDWPRALVSRDGMMRVLQNLIGNAVKFRIAGRTPEIIVTSEIIGNEWCLSVADNGVGILPDQAHRLFQVFQRLQSRAAFEGTGIGLALCRKIAEHHGGRIEAESAGEGQGSTFRVRLPLEVVNAADDDEEKALGVFDREQSQQTSNPQAG